VAYATWALALLGVVAFWGAPAAGEHADPTEPDDYRTDNYRAPTPLSLQGARTVSTKEAAALWRDKAAVFVDVMPQAPRPANLPAGTIWRDKPRYSIPGSAWLPDTGYGQLAAVTEAYLRNALAILSGDDRARPLVVFCLRDCWMSWNAARRAVAWGYTNVIWYPDGTDGWQEADLPLEQVQPMRRPGE
jgi:PQQ-dependent catabolism-associated CXXCW motif protein